MINFEDTVITKWHPHNISYYKEKGYKYTGVGTELEVKIKDLTKGSNTLIPITCDFCGEKTYRKYTIYRRSSNHEFDACDKCKTIKSHISIRNNNIDLIWEKLEDRCSKLGYKLISQKDEYKNPHTLIKYICPLHDIQQSEYGNIINGHGCKQCARENNRNKTKNKINNVVENINKFNNNILLNPDEYINANTKNLKVLCGCCGKNIMIVDYHNYMHGSHRCNACNNIMSNGEYQIKTVLEKNNIKYIQEKTFSKCKDKKLLPFDFYLPEYNKCIEFDGEQHYNPHFYISRNLKNPIELFETIKRHDEIKNQFCKDNNISLLRIPYWKQNKVENIILDYLELSK